MLPCCGYRLLCGSCRGSMGGYWCGECNKPVVSVIISGKFFKETERAVHGMMQGRDGIKTLRVSDVHRGEEVTRITEQGGDMER